MKSKFKKSAISILILALVLFLMFLFVGEDEATITSFQECIDAGYPVMESYPRQCSIPGGETFTEELIGGQRDSKGCLAPAGYSFNQEIGACAREWEFDYDRKRAARIAVNYVGFEEGLTVIGVSRAQCNGCFVVRFERYDERFSVSLENWKVVK